MILIKVKGKKKSSLTFVMNEGDYLTIVSFIFTLEWLILPSRLAF